MTDFDELCPMEGMHTLGPCLACLNTLTGLDLPGVCITDDDMATILSYVTTLKALEVLNLGGNFLGKRSGEVLGTLLSNLPALRELQLLEFPTRVKSFMNRLGLGFQSPVHPRIQVMLEFIPSLTTMNTLQMLDLSNSEMGGIGLEALLNSASVPINLRDLNLRSNSLVAKDPAWLICYTVCHHENALSYPEMIWVMRQYPAWQSPSEGCQI